MKKGILLAAIALIAISSLILAETNVPETPNAVVGGTLTIGIGESFKSLDAFNTHTMYDNQVAGQIFDTLWTLHPDTLKAEPFIAKLWEVSEDGSEVTFYLNEGITFHNGEALTAEDVAFSLNHLADISNGYSKTAEITWMKEAVVVDDYTCKIILKPEYTPYCPMFSRAGITYVVPKDTFLEMGEDAFNSNPVGSGPYRFVEWVEGSHITLERNEDYWLVYPNLDQIVFRNIPETSVMMLELESGGIDISDTVTGQDLARLDAMEHIEVQRKPGLTIFYLGFNMSHLPSSDIRFRKAVYMSTDFDGAVFSILRGVTGIRAYGGVPAASWANDVEYLKENVALKEDDVEAKRLFDELKAEGIIPANFKTTIYCPTDPRRTQLATIVATNLKELGVNAEVQPLDFGTLTDIVMRRGDDDPEGSDFEMYLYGLGGEPDPNSFLYQMLSCETLATLGGNNYSNYCNPVASDLLNEAANVPGCDQDAREALYVEAQRMIYADYPHIPAYHYLSIHGVNTRVNGYEIPSTAHMVLCSPNRNVWVEEK
jgi:peptide/nickel transport system substrate-binding protein